jgi:hypothetical protein
MTKILRLELMSAKANLRQVGRVHPDGSITFRGRRYCTLKDVPPECKALRPDIETHRQWRELYRPIDPRLKRKSSVLELQGD